MDINQIIAQVKEKFGDKIDVDKVKVWLSSIDLSKVSLPEIMEKLKASGMAGAGDLKGAAESLKSKASDLLGGLKGKLGH